MLLVGAEPLPPDTTVLFDIALADGSKPIRAEGRVVGVIPDTADRPGGLRVRFRRFGAATKAFIERAVSQRVDEARPSQPEVALPRVTAELSAPPPPPLESGVRERIPGPIAAPANREELLARLRERKKAG
jgi:hypothetical protein